MSALVLRPSHRRHAPAVLTAAIGGLVYLLWDPPTKDLANQHLRSAVFADAPFAPWNNMWFGGHHTPGYSLLAPPLGWLIGPEMLGALAVVAGALLGSLLTHRLAQRSVGVVTPVPAAVLLAVGLLASLYGGRTAFLIGAAFAIGSLLVALDERRAIAGLLAVLAAASSPVIALFICLIGAATWMSRSLTRATSVSLAAPPAVLVLALALLFPDVGTFEMPIGLLLNTLAATALIAVAWRRSLTVRWGALGSAVLCVLVAVVDNPVGGNATRLVATVAPAMLVCTPLTPRRWVNALALVPLLALQWSPVSLAFTGDRAQMADSFYDPLLAVLAAQPQPLRVEVVPVVTHSEASVVGQHVPLARGWNRQLDRFHHPLFYADALDPADYKAWLVANGVAVVAIADTELDYAGRLEAALLGDPPDYLRLIHSDETWRIFEVVPRPALVVGTGAVTAITSDSFTVDAPAAGEIEVLMRFSPWLRVASGDACLRASDDGWVTLVVAGPGSVRVEAALSWRGVLDRDGDC